MNKKRVLEVAFPALNNSGVPAVIMGIVKELHDDLDFDVLVFRKNAGYHEKEFKSYGGTVYHINCDKTHNSVTDLIEKIRRPWRLYCGTRRILREVHYDAIHCHNGFDACWCLLAAKREGVSIRAVHSHASTNPFESRGLGIRFYERLSRWIIHKNANKMISCSESAALRLFGDKKRVHVIYNAIDLNRFNPALFCCKIIDSSSPTITYVGLFSIEKNTEFVIDVFNSIHNSITSASLLLIGFGNQKGNLENRIEKYSIGDSVSFLPPDSNIPEVLSISDVFIMPSQAEGFGIALLEAQSMGVPSFASDTVPKETNVGLCRYLPLSCGEDEWAKEIISTLNESDGKRVFPPPELMERYSWNRISKQYLSVLTELD